MSDSVFKEDFPKTQGNLQIYNLTIFIFLSIEKGKGNVRKILGGGTIWGSGINLEEKVHRIIACSTNVANGLFILHYDEDLEAFRTETDRIL